MFSGFNPRPREGATSSTMTLARFITVSIHAPVKGRLLVLIIHLLF